MTRIKKLLITTATTLLLTLPTTAHAGPVIAGQEFVECKGTGGGLVCVDEEGRLWKCPWGKPCYRT